MIFEDFKKYFIVRVTLPDQQSIPIAFVKMRRWFSCIRWLILVLLVDLGAQGCKKFVQIGPPNTLLVTANVYNNNSTATSALTSIYSQMFINSESFRMSQDLGLLADELTNHSTVPTQVQFYTNAMTPTNSNGE